MHNPFMLVTQRFREDLQGGSKQPDSVARRSPLLADYVAAEQRRRMDEESRLDAAIEASNAFDEKHGSFADEYSNL